MTVRVYRSTDVGAPTLNGLNGSLLDVLDWCLVSGAPTPAGWTKEYSGTNKAAYKQGTGSNGFYLRVDDAYTATNYARVVGYETMTDIDTGTNVFPYLTQLEDGGYVLKSDSTDSNSRPWVMIASEKLFYFWNAHNTTADTYRAWVTVFGDFESYIPNDSYNTVLMSGYGISYTTSLTGVFNNTPIYTAGNYVARGPDQIGGSVNSTNMTITTITGGFSGRGAIPYPDPNEGGLILLPIYISHAGYSGGASMKMVRGRLPGLWAMGHDLYATYTTGDTFSGAVGSSLAGKTFEMFRGYASSTTSLFVIETSDTW